MNLQKDLNEIQQIQYPKLCQGTNEFNGISWDELENRFIYSPFQIILKDQEIQYLKEGSIIRSHIINNDSQYPEYLTNLGQIKFLKWIGIYNQRNQKIGKWIATWKGGTLLDIGGYYNEGQKQGLWKEITKNYWNYAQVYEFGEYQNDQRQGTWKYIYKEKEIGRGQYNQTGEKHGKWIQVSDNFWDQSEVIYIGEYKNGKKIGIWDIWFNLYGIDNWIGGGSYDEGGQELKVGDWIDISNGFWFHSGIIYNGKYKKGQKIGKWKSFWYEEAQIGGGSYDEEGQGMKIGNWIEVSDRISDTSIITYNGEYINGQKVGRWDTRFTLEGNNEQIGGGEYDKKGQGQKIGNWIEISDGFYLFSQVTLNGEYKNGKKVGRWNIYYKNTLIGGGLYDEEGQEAKIGDWIEISDEFSGWSQVNYYGTYQNGKKVGRWNIWSKDVNQNEYKQIGGGQYDEGGFGLKVGNWIEISDGFKNETQVTYIGEYQNGIKVGRWEIWGRYSFDSEKIDNIGGGQYDQQGQGVKVGKWIEISDGYLYNSEIIYAGEYKDDKKIGIWVELDIYNQEKFNEINYDE